MKFITFEGCDFCGKSTQVKLLGEFLKNKQKKVFITREPGGSDFGEQIRDLLLSNKYITDPLIEYLLLAAARKDHVDNVIKKKLQEDYYVISDRFYDSSLCYQGHYKNLNFKIIEEIKNITIGQFQPNITFIINISNDELKKRITMKRIGNNVYDKKELKFYKTIRDGYLKIAKDNPERIFLIDGDRGIADVQKEINRIVQREIL